jgi:hypothetical protein
MPYYAEVVRELYARNGWKRAGAVDYVPHDARVTEWDSSKSRLEQMIEKEFKPQIAKELSLEDGINAVRAVLPVCEFDADAAAEASRRSSPTARTGTRSAARGAISHRLAKLLHGHAKRTPSMPRSSKGITGSTVRFGHGVIRVPGERCGWSPR